MYYFFYLCIYLFFFYLFIFFFFSVSIWSLRWSWRVYAKLTNHEMAGEWSLWAWIHTKVSVWKCHVCYSWLRLRSDECGDYYYCLIFRERDTHCTCLLFPPRETIWWPGLFYCTPIPFWKEIYFKRKDFAPMGSKVFPFRIGSFSEERKNNADRFASP